MHIRIRDWNEHFEQDRSRQWKTLKWVPIPNKQGLGYKKIMNQKNGAEIFGCWNALVQVASLCNPRGDLSKYTIDDLSVNTLIPLTILKSAISFIVQNLDWIEVIENPDINVNENDISCTVKPVDSSILFNSLRLNDNKLPINIIPAIEKRERKKNKFDPPAIEEVQGFFIENGYLKEKATEFHKYYSEGNPPWYDQKGNPVRSWKQKARVVWFKEDAKIVKSPQQNQSIPLAYRPL